MKKILIALPLVLIMILSMVPVFAEDTAEKDTDVATTLTFFNDVHMKNVKESYDIKDVTVKESVAKDEAKLKAAMEKIVADRLKKFEPATEGKFEWIWDVKVTPMKTVKTEAKLSSKEAEALADQTLATFVEAAKKSNVTVNTSKFSGDTSNYKVKDALITKVNAAIDELVAGKDPKATKEVAAEDTDVDKTGAEQTNQVKLKELVVTEGTESVEPAKATINVYPDRVLKDEKKEDKKEEKKCYVACDFITVKVINAITGKELTDLTKKFEVVKGQIPEISAAYEYMTEILKFETRWQLATNFVLSPAIFAPENLENCEARMYVIPKRIAVNVIHELYNCCKNPDGTIYQENYYPYMSFIEEDQTVPFIEFTTQRIINQVKAEEWATTRIQKLNSGEWVFESAMFIDTLDAGRYLTGKVFNADGTRAREDIVRTWKYRKIDMPTIIIKYRAAVCVEKAEEKVDNATVENGNATTAPVTANGGANLPATGAKDVSAFFLSAVALLGLGIFFAKKH